MVFPCLMQLSVAAYSYSILQTPEQTIGLRVQFLTALFYCCCALWGPKFTEKRKSFNLDAILFVYNALQVPTICSLFSVFNVDTKIWLNYLFSALATVQQLQIKILFSTFLSSPNQIEILFNKFSKILQLRFLLDIVCLPPISIILAKIPRKMCLMSINGRTNLLSPPWPPGGRTRIRRRVYYQS